MGSSFEIYKKVPHDFNVMSRQILGEIFYKEPQARTTDETRYIGSHEPDEEL